MSSLTDYMYDTSYVEEALSYLETAHSIQARVVDAQGRTVYPAGDESPSTGASRLFPFSAFPRLGGLRCCAATEALLTKAAPHIGICLRGMEQLLQREAELQQTSDEMLGLSEQFHFLYTLAGRIIGISDPQEFCSVILQEIGIAIEADAALVNATRPWQEQLEITWQLTPARRREIKLQGLLNGMSQDRIVIRTLPDHTSTLLAPIRGKEGVIGHLAFFRDPHRPPFSAYQKKFVSIIENIYSPTLETIRLYDSLEDLYLNTVKALAAAIDAKDAYTHGHSFRVARYAVAIGKNMELADRALMELEIAAYMHDLGKIGVPESILSKPGKLTSAEFMEIKKHPVLTNKILEPINLPAFIVDAAIHHHERLDGSGYPDGLQGDQISPFARIIAVADVFDALTSERPYRQAMPVEDALQLLCENTEVKFDREVILAFIASLQKDDELDTVLADTNIDLNFTAIHHLNDFLVELTGLLLDPEAQNHQLGSASTNRLPV